MKLIKIEEIIPKNKKKSLGEENNSKKRKKKKKTQKFKNEKFPRNTSNFQKRELEKI